MKGDDFMRRKRVYVRAHADLVNWIKEQTKKVNRTTSNLIVDYVLILYKENSERKAKND